VTTATKDLPGRGVDRDSEGNIMHKEGINGCGGAAVVDEELDVGGDDKLVDDKTVVIEGEKRWLSALSRVTLDGSWQAHNKWNRCTR
jgi:hypothetical protein